MKIRKAWGVLLDVVGASLGLVGIELGTDVFRSIVDLVQQLHQSTAPLQHPLTFALKSPEVMNIFIIAPVSAICIGIAIWVLEPVRRYRDFVRSDANQPETSRISPLPPAGFAQRPQSPALRERVSPPHTQS